MDISALASVAMGLLSPYLAKGAEEFAKATGKAAAEKVSDLYRAVKKKFQGNVYAEQTLGRVEEQPDSKNRQATLEGLLVELLEKDPSFAKMVQRLIEEVREADSGNISNVIQRIKQEAGDNAIQIGQARDVNITH